jgi:hypothetical protein
MQTKKGIIDRSKFPPGPWDAEEDRYEWWYKEYPCIIMRNGAGSLCGYIGLPPGHPWYNRSYGSLCGWDDDDSHPSYDIDVHGGLTYSDSDRTHELTPKPPPRLRKIVVLGAPPPKPLAAPIPFEAWWLGFDAGHSFDLVPLLASRGLSMDGSRYRTFEYVKAEVEKLADQAIEAVRP